MGVSLLLICAMLVCTTTISAPFFGLYDLLYYDSSSEEEKTENIRHIYIYKVPEPGNKTTPVYINVGPVNVSFPNIGVMANVNGNFNTGVNSTTYSNNTYNISKKYITKKPENMTRVPSKSP